MFEHTIRQRPLVVNRPRRRATTRLATLELAVILGLGALTACGKEDDDTPTPTATSAATATSTSASGSATPQTAGALTVGALADRIAAVWPGVSTYRAVTTTNAQAIAGSPVGGASPAAAPSAITASVDEIVLPDRKRRVARAGDVVQFELLVVSGKVYARGPLAPGLDPSRPDPTAWVEIDPAALETSSAHAAGHADLLAPVTAPYSALSQEERARDAVPLGQTTVDGRACTAYRIADTTRTGERIEIVLSLGDDSLPCAIETRAGGQVTTTVFAYNVPLTIEAPAAATPLPR